MRKCKEAIKSVSDYANVESNEKVGDQACDDVAGEAVNIDGCKCFNAFQHCLNWRKLEVRLTRRHTTKLQFLDAWEATAEISLVDYSKNYLIEKYHQFRSFSKGNDLKVMKIKNNPFIETDFLSENKIFFKFFFFKRLVFRVENFAISTIKFSVSEF
ncbi:unnamed protein product [Ceratitis capitata]|uniref:(Mediterranean fruit fly) hypothetical protein n=1 Tax=Ceratitis capitata TaxID=7213 RepID=A0A811VEX9_CERCA|nr:unnamed protein product [Ceratitis capitata]